MYRLICIGLLCILTIGLVSCDQSDKTSPPLASGTATTLAQGEAIALVKSQVAEYYETGCTYAVEKAEEKSEWESEEVTPGVWEVTLGDHKWNVYAYSLLVEAVNVPPGCPKY